jgi:peroxiredoxin
MGQSDSQKSQQTIESHSPRKRQRGALVALIVFAIAAAAWGGAVTVMRRPTTVDAVLNEVLPDTVARQGSDLPSERTGGPAFSVWVAGTTLGGNNGTLYTTMVPNPASTSAASRLLLSPASVELGVFVDTSATIQNVWMLSPRVVAGAPADLGDYLASWQGVTLYQVLVAEDGIDKVGGGTFAEPVSGIISDLAGSIYLKEMGREGFDRFLAQIRSPGIRVGNQFSYFSAPAWDGTTFDINSLKGRNVLIAFTDPTCGSCAEAVMKLLTTIQVRGFDVAPVVFVFSARGLETVERFAKEVPQGTTLISDPERDIARSIHQTLAPYAVLLDPTQKIVYSGSANRDAPIYESLEELAGVQ